MSEQDQVKKRAWVKNAAIIFLAVMLVLTLFSNTILNHSLPEVAVKYAEPGTINAKIRGTGTVTANQSYEVSIQQSRKVESVAVKVGDNVAAGDLLFTLAEAESSELEAAKDELDAMVLAYRLALIDASGSDYARDNYDVKQLQTKLQKAQNESSQYYVSEAELNQAKENISVIKSRISQLTSNLEGLGGSGSGNIDELEDQLDAAEDALSAAKIAYRAELEYLKTAAQEKMAAENGRNLDIYMAALAIEFANSSDDPEKIAVAAAYNEVANLQKQVDQLEQTIDNDTSDQYNGINKQIKDAELELEKAQSSLDALEEKHNKWLTANENAESYQNQLDDKLFALAEQQKEDNKAQRKDSLNLADQQKKISELQKKINELEADAVDGTIVAAAAGVVSAVNVTAGNETLPGEAMAVIESQDLGYSLSFPVTMEQAQKVTIGDSAEVSNYYWGPPITATLTAIKNDPENPGKGKLLQFRLDGEDLSAGSQLSVAIGTRSASYDVIVPNSALHTDSNGSFVLIVTAKSTPLGNRYYANRVDVNVLATDDLNSAISGGIASYDYVLTTSTKPIEPGQMVRLIEN